MEPSELQVLGRGVDERVQGHQADDLALRNLDAFFRREAPNRLECLEERRLAIIHHVHGNLNESAIGEFESFRPDGRQPSVALPDRLRDALRHADIRGPEVHVPGDEDGPRALLPPWPLSRGGGLASAEEVNNSGLGAGAVLWTRDPTPGRGGVGWGVGTPPPGAAPRGKLGPPPPAPRLGGPGGAKT